MWRATVSLSSDNLQVHYIINILQGPSKLQFSLFLKTQGSTSHEWRINRNTKLPYPEWRPFLLASFMRRARDREWILVGFLIMKPSLTNFLMFWPAHHTKTFQNQSFQYTNQMGLVHLLFFLIYQIKWKSRKLQQKNKKVFHRLPFWFVNKTISIYNVYITKP